MPSWTEELTDEEVEALGRGSLRVAVALTVLVGVLVVVALAVGLAAASAEAQPAYVAGKAEYGYGQVRYGGRGPEAWRWQLVLEKRDHQADETRDGRRIRRLQRELQRGFIPWYWVAVGSCESGLRWAYNGSSGFDGAVQFHPGTWAANRLPGYPEFAWQATPFQQLVVAEIVLARSGWGQWPACSRKVGLR